MQVTTFEGVVQNGQIRLTSNIQLPESTKVYVLIPGLEDKRTFRVYSPRLVHPEQAIDFKKQLVEEEPNASL